MAWLFLIAAAAGFLFTLPGGTRSRADRQMAQGMGFAALAAALMAWKLFPVGVGVAIIGATLFGIGWFKSKMLDDGFQDIDDEPVHRSTPPSRPAQGQMSREEALAVLGLPATADAALVREAHRRVIAKAHPDSGGSDYLASKVNEARDVLLK
ncbi:hypothetical protein [Parvularcula sp. LCG005]|uniref:hypothetical protein n=1 Tax=Parvularcula sp. LCG005 TaxID=3078805 RepID=UPI0029431B68|nr:hypothetical protein [Parvularcula sp. LCG005]WOI54152.1 hypothetical protein RUI03_03905 [Parvularcula sp. LCG005]